jgi:hypothetical protein
MSKHQGDRMKRTPYTSSSKYTSQYFNNMVQLMSYFLLFKIYDENFEELVYGVFFKHKRHIF